MARVRIGAGMDARAARIARPHVDRVRKDVEREAKRLAPAVKEWTSQRDLRVRPTHVQADRQRRPQNLRFELHSHPWDMGIGRNPESEGKPRVGPFSYFDHPGEQVEGAYVNWVHCRCFITPDPQGLAREVQSSPAVVTGSVVRARVWVTAPYAVEAELGDVYPGGYVADGTYFMARAARAGAKRSRRR